MMFFSCANVYFIDSIHDHTLRISILKHILPLKKRVEQFIMNHSEENFYQNYLHSKNGRNMRKYDPSPSNSKIYKKKYVFIAFQY